MSGVLAEYKRNTSGTQAKHRRNTSESLPMHTPYAQDHRANSGPIPTGNLAISPVPASIDAANGAATLTPG